MEAFRKQLKTRVQKVLHHLSVKTVMYGKIDRDLERKFRLKAVEKYSCQKGAVIKASEEAIKLWLKS